MMNLLTLVCREESVLKSWVYALDEISTYGARWYAKHGSGNPVTVGLTEAALAQVDDENDREPWLIGRVRAKFTSDALVQFNLKMNSLDALSQVGALAFDDPGSSEKWESINPKVWVGWASKGCNALVHGRVKSGKSNIALLLSEHFLASEKFVVVSNIAVSNPPEKYRYCPRLSTMLTAICNTRLAGKEEVLIILDESNLFWQKIETIMPKNISLAKLILVFGKLHSNLVFISHYSELVPSIVARTAVATFEKRSIKECFVSINEGIRIKPRLLTSVPATTLEYNPDQLSFFSLDLDVNALFDFMASLPEKTEQWQAILDYVAKHLGETGEDALDPKDVALWLRKRGKSERDIATLVQRSPSTIHQWVSSSSAEG